jgi:hypothetical protein
MKKKYRIKELQKRFTIEIQTEKETEEFWFWNKPKKYLVWSRCTTEGEPEYNHYLHGISFNNKHLLLKPLNSLEEAKLVLDDLKQNDTIAVYYY